MATINDENKRLALALKDEKLSQVDFAKLADMDQSVVSRMVNGKTPVTLEIWKTLIYNFGYSSQWCIDGKGPKKKDSAGAKITTITELQMLRIDYDFLATKVLSMEARMKAYEKEIDELRAAKTA